MGRDIQRRENTGGGNPGALWTDTPGTAIGSCLLDNERDIYEPELNVYRVVYDFQILDEE